MPNSRHYKGLTRRVSKLNIKLGSLFSSFRSPYCCISEAAPPTPRALRQQLTEQNKRAKPVQRTRIASGPCRFRSNVAAALPAENRRLIRSVPACSSAVCMRCHAMSGRGGGGEPLQHEEVGEEGKEGHGSFQREARHTRTEETQKDTAQPHGQLQPPRRDRARSSSRSLPAGVGLRGRWFARRCWVAHTSHSIAISW